MKRGKNGMMILLAVIFCVSTVLFLRGFLAGDSYDEALDLATRAAEETGSPTEAPPVTTQPAPTETEPPEPVWVPAPVEDEDPQMEKMMEIDLEALRETNPDVVGWIRIPDTKIDYPLMQGTDNDYYLKHTWDHRKQVVGSIFLEYRNSPDLTDFNTIVYGHNMNNGSMFAGIRQFAVKKYCRQHPYVYIRTDAGVYRYEIFSSYKADVDSETYGLSFRQTETRERFLAHALEKSQPQLDIVPEITDRILTLSTCSGVGYTSRWVVHARLPMIQAEP